MNTQDKEKNYKQTPRINHKAAIMKSTIWLLLTFIMLTLTLAIITCPAVSEANNNYQEINPITLYEDNNNFWTATGVGNGTLGITAIPANDVKQTGNQSLQINIINGIYSYVEVGHNFGSTQNWTSYENLAFWFWGTNSSDTVEISIAAPDSNNQFWITFTDNFTGWTNIVTPLAAMAKIGNPSLTNVTQIGFFFFNIQAFYLDHVILDDTDPLAPQTTQPDTTAVAVVVTTGTGAAAGAGAYVARAPIISKPNGAAAKAAKSTVGGEGGKGGGESVSGGAPGGPPPAHIPVGANVCVLPHPNVILSFTNVEIAGAATAVPLAIYPPHPSAKPFVGTVFDIKTSAVFSGTVLVGLAFDGKNMTNEQKKKLRVYRNDFKKGSVWEDVTSEIDVKKNIAYGVTDHFSGFGIH